MYSSPCLYKIASEYLLPQQSDKREKFVATVVGIIKLSNEISGKIRLVGGTKTSKVFRGVDIFVAQTQPFSLAEEKLLCEKFESVLFAQPKVGRQQKNHQSLNALSLPDEFRYCQFVNYANVLHQITDTYLLNANYLRVFSMREDVTDLTDQRVGSTVQFFIRAQFKAKVIHLTEQQQQQSSSRSKPKACLKIVFAKIFFPLHQNQAPPNAMHELVYKYIGIHLFKLFDPAHAEIFHNDVKFYQQYVEETKQRIPKNSEVKVFIESLKEDISSMVLSDEDKNTILEKILPQLEK